MTTQEIEQVSGGIVPMLAFAYGFGSGAAAAAVGLWLSK
ncbi:MULTISPECIES: class IIb bacteriocin, lactobin A/cerein 7B family [unclassified Undibacterium]